MESENKEREFARFNSAMSKILKVSHEELKHRESEWKENSKRKKRAKALRASRAARA